MGIRKTLLPGFLLLAANGVQAQYALGPIETRIFRTMDNIEKQDAEYRSVIALNNDAVLQAKLLDRLSEEGRRSKILLGMPVLLKDNIESVELPTTAGSLALKNNRTGRDAPLVTQLRDAGAVIVGKTNLSEWANFRSDKSISGWSAAGGQTVNPHDKRRSPCGSSSGSAVAVALGYVPVAIGTETHGSIVCPASINGVVGIKPTHGLIRPEGIVPIASSQDTAGPFARNIPDAARALAAMVDPQVTGYTDLIDGLINLEGEAKTYRIGVVASSMGYDARRDAFIKAGIQTFKRMGAEVVEGIRFNTPDGFWDGNYQKLQYEFRRDLNAYLAGLPNELNALTLEKLIAFNKAHADTELAYFGQEIFEQSQQLEMTERKYKKLLKKGIRVAGKKGLDALFAKHDLDALIGITTGPAWLIDTVNGDAFFGSTGMSGFPAIAGNPHITVPIGRIAGLPIGLSFIGKRFEDHKLAQVAHRFVKQHQSADPPSPEATAGD